MNADEKFKIQRFECECYEDNFEKGEVGPMTSWWGNKEIPIDGRYNTILDALKAVCLANGFEFSKENWESWGQECNEDYGRFYTDFLVDKDNTEASEEQIEKWKNGNLTLYSCHLNVWLKVVYERELTNDECKI